MIEAFPEIANVLETTPGVLRGIIRAAAPEQLDWQPSAERWSISMVLAHLADVEGNGFLSRFTAMLDQDGAFLPRYDQLELFRSRQKFDGWAELAQFERQRIQTLAWLKSLPASAAARSGRHEDLGVLSFNELLNEFAFHDLGHIRQVIELHRSHVFYPRIGVFQNFYRVNP